ncbi:MAG: HAD-IA family hydrolase [Bacteroidetes bacterium]|nr:HAD-IA family hydrolase [Bacteroidota bacterium]
MEKFEGIIFDVDGTLTSTNELIFESFRHVSNKYLGRNFTDEEIIGLFGPTEDVILKELFLENYIMVRKDYYDFYSSNHSKMADSYPGIKEIVIKIKKANIPLSIYTGKGRDSAAITLKEIGIYDYFDMIVSGDDVKDHKPSREGVDMFVDKFGLNRNNTLLVGDSTVDIKAARNSGIKIASVVWDSYGKEKVIAMGSDYLFHTVEEFDDFISERI